MTDLNTVILRGRLVRDASEGMKQSANGTAWGSFKIVVNKSERGADGKYADKGNFIEVKAFGKFYETCVPHLTKGSYVTVRGSLSQETWEKDEQKNSKIVVVADEIFPTWQKKDEGGAPHFKPSDNKPADNGNDFQEDFPF